MGEEAYYTTLISIFFKGDVVTFKYKIALGYKFLVIPLMVGATLIVIYLIPNYESYEVTDRHNLRYFWEQQYLSFFFKVKLVIPFDKFSNLKRITLFWLRAVSILCVVTVKMLL